MEHLSVLLVLGSCLTITFQDFKSRSISIWALGLYLGAVALYAVLQHRSLLDTGFNLLFIGILLGTTVGMVTLVKKRPYQEVIGLGDVLFLVISTPLFQLTSFVIWIPVGLFVSLLTHLVLIRSAGTYRKQATIPLAGMLALIFSIAAVTEVYVNPISEYIH